MDFFFFTSIFFYKTHTHTQINKGQPRTGAYMSGFYMMGARFDTSTLLMTESKPKELFCTMPIVTCSAILATEVETGGVFESPCYKTEFRGPTFVFSAQIRTKHPNAKWVLAGVAGEFSFSSFLFLFFWTTCVLLLFCFFLCVLVSFF